MSIPIKFYTSNEIAFKHFRPEPIKKFIPQWYIDMKMEVRDEENPGGGFAWKTAKEFFQRGDMKALRSGGKTAKACIPMRDYMTSGYVIRTFSDVAFTVEQREEGEIFWYVAGDTSQINIHKNWQLPNTGDGKRRDYIKFFNPWVINTPPGYSCLFYQPDYLFERRFKLFPAIVDTDGHDMTVEFPGMFTTDGSFTIEAGTPLMCVFPFKRDEFQSEVEFGPPKKSLIESALNNGYRRYFRKKKLYE
jgi:hypothetical protein